MSQRRSAPFWMSERSAAKPAYEELATFLALVQQYNSTARRSRAFARETMTPSRAHARNLALTASRRRRVTRARSQLPEEVTRHYLRQGGVDCEDESIVKLVSLATDKFVAEVVHDAIEFGRLRALRDPSSRAADADAASPLQLQDVMMSLSQRGVNVLTPAEARAPTGAADATR